MPILLSDEVVRKRAANLRDAVKEISKDVDNIHIKLQPGNTKTGINCWTVSLLPVVDCSNCKKCANLCYDLNHDMIYPRVVYDRAKNSAVHKADPDRFWSEVDMQIKANYVKELRLNVGGDLSDDDFAYVAKLGRKNPKTMILFFTKNYKGINKFLEHHRFPKNVKAILSTWEDVKMDNPNNLPQSHVLHADGRTTAPSYGSIFCGGNCSECAFNEVGCWTLKKGEHVIFTVH